jgi:hypothetical protein
VVATDVFPPLTNPGSAATILTGMMAAQITETHRLHIEVTRVYCTYHNVYQAFKKLIIDAFEDLFLNALSDEIVYYNHCTSLQFVSHLLMYYATIAPTEPTQNYERINTPYDPNQPIENLLQQIQDARAFAVVGGQPYGDVMIVNVVFTLVFNTGVFPDASCAGQARAVEDKTWMQFKRDFTGARLEFRLTNQTAQQSDFHGANMIIEQGRGETMQDTIDAIVQLATTMASYRGTVATLTATYDKLDLQLETAHAYSNTLNDSIVALKAKIKPA